MRRRLVYGAQCIASFPSPPALAVGYVVCNVGTFRLKPTHNPQDTLNIDR